MAQLKVECSEHERRTIVQKQKLSEIRELSNRFGLGKRRNFPSICNDFLRNLQKLVRGCILRAERVHDVHNISFGTVFRDLEAKGEQVPVADG